MKAKLKSTTIYYNPMQIDGNGKHFEFIQITDGDKVLFKFNWFTRFETSSNSTNEIIELDAKLVRSVLVKNKLRYTGKQGNYVLSIDKSLLDYELVKTSKDRNEYSDTLVEVYKLKDLDAYFVDRTKMPPTPKQKAYAELSDRLENEWQHLSMYDVKRVLAFYKDNKTLFDKVEL